MVQVLVFGSQAHSSSMIAKDINVFGKIVRDSHCVVRDSQIHSVVKKFPTANITLNIYQRMAMI